MEETWNVGTYLSKFLNHLIEDVGIDAKSLHLIGHSLGAHVVGFAARQVKNGKIGRITGNYLIFDTDIRVLSIAYIYQLGFLNLLLFLSVSYIQQENASSIYTC